MTNDKAATSSCEWRKHLMPWQHINVPAVDQRCELTQSHSLQSLHSIGKKMRALRVLLSVLLFLSIDASISVTPSKDHGAVSLQELDREVTSLFEDELHKLPVTMTKDSGNIEVRVRWDGDRMLTFCEAKHVDLHPNQFRTFLGDFSRQFSKVNPMAKEIIDLECDPHNNREAVKTVLAFPFPLSDRLMIHYKYLQLDRSPDEHLLILSERGNDKLLEKYWTEEEKKKLVLARTFLCAYWIKPVRNGTQVVGSKVQYMFSGDTGGNVPQWLQSAVGPKTAYDSVHGLIRHVQRK